MSIYFVYRSPYEGPSGKLVRTFADDKTVLGWFQRRWQRLAQCKDIRLAVDAELDCHVYGFDSIFEAILEHELAPPQSIGELRKYLNKYLYVEGEIDLQENYLQVLTDDDEFGLVYYFFDDHYLQAHTDRATYLLHRDWKLPVEAVAENHTNFDFEFKGSFASGLRPSGTSAGNVKCICCLFHLL
ncbi:MAG: hypothetical protein ACAI35_19785 [Candidatus Methylacidiphilales bacterium]|nr:hypothetical protein [Candidatus Methylacidiphilales bacterium]